MEIREAGCPLGAKCEEVKEENGKQYIARCPWYVKVKGKDPQSEVELDHFACAIAWLPTLLINTAQQTHQAGAAVESLRNEVVKGTNETNMRLAGLGFRAAQYPNQPLLQNGAINEQ